MQVYIGNLSARATTHDIRTLGGRAARGGVFRRLPQWSLSTDSCYYCVMETESDKQARHLIRRLAGKEYHGRCLVAREFVARSNGNDRRAPGWRLRPWRGVERRVSDRRATIH